MRHNCQQSPFQHQAEGRGTLPCAGQAVRLAAVQPVDQQQRTGTALCRKGDADAPVRQTHPVHREERRLFRFELFLPQGAAPSDRVRESGKVTVREKPHERGYGKNDRSAIETQDMNKEQKYTG